jgi:hypothetical protein
VESKLNQSSTFYLSLPLIDPGDEPTAQASDERRSERRESEASEPERRL